MLIDPNIGQMDINIHTALCTNNT